MSGSHFIEADCKTTIGGRTRYFKFAMEQEFRGFVSRCTSKIPPISRVFLASGPVNKKASSIRAKYV